jgi:cyclopropane fatty-acyl-phospholipid synthase-like methyltransferase
MMRLAKLSKNDRVLDLGSGDGRLVVEIARRGLEAHGVEINLFLVLISRLIIKIYGLSKSARIKWGNMWRINVSDYDVVFIYAISHIMGDLEKKLKDELESDAKVVSYAYKFPHWKPEKSEKGVYLYRA